MSDIEFRGKDKETGKWVYGYYVKVTEPYYKDENSCWYDSSFNKAPGDYICDKLNRLIAVIPETVGQWTGLYAKTSYRGTNKEDLKIYEGDITKDVDYGYGYVRYINGSYCIYFPKYEMDFKVLSYVPIINIIGTIHDNPELLESSD